MPRIAPLELDEAPGKSKSLLESVHKALGMAPNLMRTLAHSPVALEAYLSFGRILGGGSLGARLREQIALTVAGVNGCDYCAAAHTALGERAGIQPDELRANLSATSTDPRTQAALQFARRVVETRGLVSDDELARVRAAGFNEGDIAEIVGVIALNVFSNYFNHVAQTELDFPGVQVREAQTA